MRATTYLLFTILIMHLITLTNIVVFDGNWNGIVMTVNTVLLILAFGLVQNVKKTIND
ncbi:putative membrane protein YqjE [Virgibacillus natechei]|uniref:Membrane protein YqjE n=1 Tax=Virgibacillus natechei TaxID=1216297 RepID=A0ABS4IIZ3_9BACI|nr:putative membrane protein YqjE [Virgibacillus natechei]